MPTDGIRATRQITHEIAVRCHRKQIAPARGLSPLPAVADRVCARVLVVLVGFKGHGADRRNRRRGCAARRVAIEFASGLGRRLIPGPHRLQHSRPSALASVLCSLDPLHHHGRARSRSQGTRPAGPCLQPRHPRSMFCFLSSRSPPEYTARADPSTPIMRPPSTSIVQRPWPDPAKANSKSMRGPTLAEAHHIGGLGMGATPLLWLGRQQQNLRSHASHGLLGLPRIAQTITIP